MTINEKMTALADAIRAKSGRTDTLTLDEMTTAVQSIEVGSGGVDLPELTNEGTAADLMLNKELIDSEGNKVTGTFTIATELATQDSLISQIQTALQGKAAGGGVELPTLNNPASASDILSGKEAIDSLGNVLTGTIATKTAANLTASGATVTVPAGYYASQATKSISTGSAKTPATTVTKNPTISVNSSGLITASVSGTQNVTPTVTAGYVSSGTAGTITVGGSTTKQLTTQAAKTITPSTSSQTAVASGVYTTGVITVEPIPGNYIVPSGTLDITTNGTHDVTEYVSVSVNVPSSGGGGSSNFLAELLTNSEISDSNLIEINKDIFRGWQYITKLSLPNVTNAIGANGYLCYGCTKLEEVYMPKCTTLGGYSFYNNTALEAIDFPSLTAVPANCFRQCTSATSVNLPAVTSLGNNAFQKDALIEKMDFPLVTSIGATAFDQCSALIVVILRKNQVCTLSNTSAFNNTPIKSGTGYIYVPSTLVDSYKTATNWSTYAAQIRAIEDYPDICGT